MSELDIPALREFLRDNLEIRVREQACPNYSGRTRIRVTLTLRGDAKEFDSDFFDLPEEKS
jgi:hypothetical protein